MDQKMVQRPKYTHKKLMRHLNLSKPTDYKIPLWLDGPTCYKQLNTTTPTTAKINTNMHEAITPR